MKYAFPMLVSIALWLPVAIKAAPANDAFNQCLLTQIATADDTVTMGELRGYCTPKEAQQRVKKAKEQLNEEIQVAETGVVTEDDSALSRRMFLEKKEALNPFVLLPHKPNYILLSNNLGSPNQTPFEDAGDDVSFQPWETKFQISLKIPVAQGLFGGRADAFVAYTNRSFWQMFNKEGSAPIRDSNHEPEAWLSFKNDFEVFGVKNSVIRTGISHQSNGQSGVLSRSWNRLYTEFIFEHDDLYVSFKPWWRIPEDDDDDENPDIDEYMGNFELGAVYKMGEHNFDVLLRNNLNFDDNYGAVQLGWTFPLTERLDGYVQWFNGYGESLIDYDSHSNSIGVGVKLSDWL